MEKLIPRSQHEFSHQDVRAYLLEKGWRVTDTIGDKAEVFYITDDQGESWDLIVPLRTNLGDYALRMKEILAALATFEDRSELAVLDDLRGSKLEPTTTAISGVADKFDDGKLPIHLITPEMIDALSNRLAFGAKKYAPRNWEQGIVYSRCFAAAMRHMWAWQGGEDFDPDPDAPHAASHLDAAFINIGFLVTFNKRGRADLDDRPKKKGT